MVSGNNMPQILCKTLLGLLGLLLSMNGVYAQWQHHDFKVMGTTAKVQLWHDDAATGRQLMLGVEQEMRRIEQLMSPYIEASELSRINREAARSPVSVSKELFELIKTSLYFSELTDGAFDITFASVGYLYDYRARKKPDSEQVEAHIGKVNYRHIVLDDTQTSVAFAEPGVRIDLGGIAKGYAVQSCVDYLQSRGVTNALVNAGGDSFVLGDKRGRPWVISVKHPRDQSRALVRLPLADVAISTSGDYERFFDDDKGQRIHHILEPKTGQPAKASMSVTIVAPDATTSDALSTSIFVLGAERGLALIDAMPNVSAVVVDKDGVVHYSKDLQTVDNFKTP